jgi:hypothetical protein
MGAGIAALLEHLSDMACDQARIAGDIDPAVPQRDHAVSGGSVVAADVPPPGIPRVRGAAVKLGSDPVCVLADIAVLAATAAHDPGLAVAMRLFQPVLEN